MLDISKAFDSVSWAFLTEVLAHLGFDPIWRNLISNLLHTASTQILVNGQPGVEIKHQGGLRQGYPLSPMLFILIMDVLNSLFTKAGEIGLLQPLARSNVSQRISLYADYGDTWQIWEALGLQTNLQKSCAIPIKCEQPVVDNISSLCLVHQLSSLVYTWANFGQVEKDRLASLDRED